MMTLELTANNFVELNCEELLIVDGGDFYDAYMFTCKNLFTGGVVGIVTVVVPIPIVNVAIGKTLADMAWNAVFN
ncbi:MAG: hypothetical protein WBL58_02850 [Peptococcia bacterium]